MSKAKFKNLKSQTSIAETAEKLGKKALQMGLISDFAIQFNSDTWQFQVMDQNQSKLLTPEEAYLHFKNIVA